MANNLADIVKVDIDLNRPPQDSASFDHILVVAPPPAAKRNPDGTLAESALPAVGVYSGLEELLDAGVSVDDALGGGMGVGFSAKVSPDKIYAAIQQPAAFDPALYAAFVTEDVSGILREEGDGDEAPQDAPLYFVLKYPATEIAPAVTKNGKPYDSAVVVSVGDVQYAVINLSAESAGTFNIALPEELSMQGKAIRLEYVARWIPGMEPDDVKVQLSNNSQLEDIAETLSRAFELDGWYMACPCGVRREEYIPFATWIEAHKKMGAVANLDARDYLPRGVFFRTLRPFYYARFPIWVPSIHPAEEFDLSKYGAFDASTFNGLELQMHQLVAARRVALWELKEVYDLDDFLKQYALFRMEKDIEAAEADRAREGAGA